MILGPDGNPIVIEASNPTAFSPIKGPTRQLLRAYLRQVAINHINKHFGPEPRRIRRSLALTLAKRKQFIEETRNVTKAW